MREHDKDRYEDILGRAREQMDRIDKNMARLKAKHSDISARIDKMDQEIKDLREKD